MHAKSPPVIPEVLPSVAEPGGRVSSRPAEVAQELADELHECQAMESGLFPGGFVKLPIALWDRGFLGQLRPAELSLLLTVFRMTNFTQGHRILARAREFRGVAGISPRAFFTAVHKLSEARIIEHKVLGKKHEIILRPPACWRLSSFQGRRSTNTTPRTESAFSTGYCIANK